MANSAGKTYAIIGGGLALAGTIVAATMITQGSPSEIKTAPPIEVPMTTAALPSEERMTVLREMDSLFADLSDEISKSVVFVRAGTDDRPLGTGSGFIYTTDGWIVTNDHVTGGQDEVTIVLKSGQEFKGKVYSADDGQLDLALVKIDDDNLPALPLANSDRVRAGQYAIAVGAPFGLQDTVTIGHVSAVDREGAVPDPRLGGIRVYNGMIQTDASINPGNSGGPLIDINGQVIGVNSTINSQSGSSAGVGFAIPANTVKIVADEIIQNKEFDRGLMGINLQGITPYELEQLGLNGGARASVVPEDGPAYKAGLRDGDVITEINGKEIRNQTDLLRAMYAASPGETAQVSYFRDGQTRNVNVKLAEPSTMIDEPQRQPQQPRNMEDFFDQFGEPRTFPEQPGIPQGRPSLGVQVMDVDDARESFNLPSGVNGAAVIEVNSGSVAERYGLEPGDVITQFDGKAINGAEALVQSVRGVERGDRVTIKVRRFGSNEAEMTLEITF